MLRRLKKEVAADLPAKTRPGIVLRAHSGPANVYQQIVEASRKQILESTGEQGAAKSRLMVLTALLRLRQVCCDLRLLNLEGAMPANSSGKLDLLGELVQEVIDGGHRVLVFSQFVSMLTLLKERLTQEEIDFCYLDGSTVDRGAVVQQFQTDPAIPFSLSASKRVAPAST